MLICGFTPSPPVFQIIIDMLEDRGSCTIHKPDAGKQQPPKQFTFDGVYYTASTTEQIYNDIAYPLVEVLKVDPR